MKRLASDLLDRRLRAEAKSLREMDGFSPLLHERIMASLRREGLASTPARPERTWTAWRFTAWAAAVAAALVVMAWIVFRSASNEPLPPRPPIVKNPAPTPKTVTPVDYAANALDQRKYAYLDRDANRLLTFVAKQLPTFPAPPNTTNTPRR